MKRFLFLLLSGLATLGAAAQTPRPAVRDTMEQRMQACVVCHGKEGRATDSGFFPRIAGKPEGYLFEQLKNFQQGRRRNEAMGHLLQHMNDDYLREIAAYFAALDLPYPPARASGLNAAQEQAARRLVFLGAPERQIPACVSCHGADMAGRLPAVPGLLTLPAGYLAAQLDGWRTGLRKAREPDCMAQLARRLSAEEASTVARWLSAQTLPAGIKPQAPSAEPLPIQCGSGQ